MPINILMPALSPTMTEGKLAKWHMKEGDPVKSGDVLAEIETDKATMEIEAVDEGILGQIVIAEGTEGVPVNNIIAVLLEEGEDKSALKTTPKSAPTPAAAKPAPQAAAPASAPATAAAPPAAAPARMDGERISASPLARRMAQQSGLDLAALRGSGPQGRIIKRDIESALSGGAPKWAPAAAPGAPGVAVAPVAAGPGAKALADLLGMTYRQEPLSGMRKVIARRLTEAKQTVPHFYLTVDCRIDELLRVRKEINGRFEDLKISVNDFVIRAAALALKQVPAANASWDDSGILLYDHADISVAVATPNGLITPIIKAAEGKGLAIISREMKDLAGRARDGKLKPEEYQGGTFSVSNLGMFGVRDFAAIINPPQGCILAVGAGEQQPVVKDGALAVATVMSCTLSVDHRVVDGAIGAEFLAAFKKLIEYPPAMLL
ncbi:MAG TPA: pyruvate dehydrogenase complex dihydrolipoamide acetyltransferase [Kiloniellales bacterium]|jgi:pyruvate dehydrogenase E2 component (dihydrolipoamide acetyltransferase)